MRSPRVPELPRLGRTVTIIALAVGVTTAALGLLGNSEEGLPTPAASRAEHGDGAGERLRWAYVREPVTARTRPAAGAPALTRLRTRTTDDTPEVLLTVAQVRGADGRRWLRARLPMRPNNRVGWVPRSALDRLYPVHTALHIDRGSLRATLYERGRPVWRAPIAVGAGANPTPGGRFFVRSRILPSDRGGGYGAFAFGTNGYSPGLSDWPGGGVVGIHGTDRPELIPGRVSHGCVRLRNRDIARLRRLMPLGTPIRIL